MKRSRVNFGTAFLEALCASDLPVRAAEDFFTGPRKLYSGRRGWQSQDV